MSEQSPPGWGRSPTFAEKMVNTKAGESNPNRVGLFVRALRRPHGRVNPGTWWELTDGRGEFWLVNPSNCVRESDDPEVRS